MQLCEELTGKNMCKIGDLSDPTFTFRLFEKYADTLIHYAEQPSAPYSIQILNPPNIHFKTIWGDL